MVEAHYAALRAAVRMVAVPLQPAVRGGAPPDRRPVLWLLVWALYFVTGLVGQLANYAWLREGGGSSTAAFGLMGAQMAYLLSQRAHMAKQYSWLAVLAICGASVMCLIRDGHGPGFVTGVIMGALIIGLSRRGLPSPVSPLVATQERAADGA
jgi:membrane associated rhomboid family serine protease